MDLGAPLVAEAIEEGAIGGGLVSLSGRVL